MRRDPVLKPISRRKLLKGALGIPMGVAWSRAAVAQDAWPTRNITMIVPFPPGGQADLAARPVAIALEKSLGRTVVVDNRAGAGGAIGNAVVAKAEPDGHTLLMTLNSVVISPEAERLYGRTPLYELDQLTPIARVLSDPNVLAVPASAPWQTLKDLVEDAKRRPGAIAYSSSGNYGATHVSIEMLAHVAGIKLLHVPYRGMGPALTGLISNQVALTAAAPGPLTPHLEAGAVRFLGTMSRERLPRLPSLPTFREQGYPVDFYVWAGLFAPKGVPQPVVDRIRNAMREAIKSPTVTAVLERAGTSADYLDAPEFAKYVATDGAQLTAAVRRIGKLE
jgi:tripartite-type tricarboxylate transporter receptor subunit TctC